MAVEKSCSLPGLVYKFPPESLIVVRVQPPLYYCCTILLYRNYPSFIVLFIV